MLSEIEDRLNRINWDGIDENIKPLVASVNLYTESFMSCEGHLDPDHSRYPYVKFVGSDDIDDLRDKVRDFNSDAGIKWSFSRSRGDPNCDWSLVYLEPDVAANTFAKKKVYEQRELLDERLSYPEDRELEDFQKSSYELAEFLKHQSDYSKLLENREF
jgi:hypothetical protein